MKKRIEVAATGNGQLNGTGSAHLPECADSTDGELVHRFASAHDEEAFAALVDRHGRLVQNLCRRLLRDPSEAEDAFQATFMVLALRASSIRKTDSVASWLYGVASRLAGK